jgi:hypothetical protein
MAHVMLATYCKFIGELSLHSIGHCIYTAVDVGWMELCELFLLCVSQLTFFFVSIHIVMQPSCVQLIFFSVNKLLITAGTVSFFRF